MRVHSIEGLRVVDASLMPTITIGEKGAAMILEDAGAESKSRRYFSSGSGSGTPAGSGVRSTFSVIETST